MVDVKCPCCERDICVTPHPDGADAYRVECQVYDVKFELAKTAGGNAQNLDTFLVWIREQMKLYEWPKVDSNDLKMR